MSETLAPPVEAPAQQGLLSRAVGVITSPRRTYAGIVARPRVFGALVLIIALTAGANLVFYNTRVGQDALLDQQIRTIESFGRQVDDAMYANLEKQAPFAGYITAGSIIVAWPLVMLLFAGIAGFFIQLALEVWPSSLSCLSTTSGKRPRVPPTWGCFYRSSTRTRSRLDFSGAQISSLSGGWSIWRLVSGFFTSGGPDRSPLVYLLCTSSSFSLLLPSDPPCQERR